MIIRFFLSLLGVANYVNEFLKIGPYSYLYSGTPPTPALFPQYSWNDVGGRPQPDVPGNPATTAMAGFPGSAQDGLLFLN